jgi:hypothetical protein
MRYIKHRLNLLHFLTDKHLNVYIHFNFFIDSTTRSSSSDLKEIAVPNMRLFEQEKSTQDLRPHGDYCPMCPPSQRKHMNCDTYRDTKYRDTKGGRPASLLVVMAEGVEPAREVAAYATATKACSRRPQHLTTASVSAAKTTALDPISSSRSRRIRT